MSFAIIKAMILLINTACEPHFVAVFDNKGTEVKAKTWENGRQDGENILGFIKELRTAEIAKVVGVTGPGGFSSLRVASVIINGLNLVNKTEIIEVSAENWGREMTEKIILCNTFGKRVLVKKGNDDLKDMPHDEFYERNKEAKVFQGFLPEDKQKPYPNEVKISPENQRKSLYILAKKTKSAKTWKPDYHFPSV